MRKRNDMDDLLQAALDKKSDKDENPEVGAPFFIYEDCIAEAAVDLRMTVGPEGVKLIKELMIYHAKNNRMLMRPPAGFHRDRSS